MRALKNPANNICIKIGCIQVNPSASEDVTALQQTANRRSGMGI
jgi:hypothetical protein